MQNVRERVLEVIDDMRLDDDYSMSDKLSSLYLDVDDLRIALEDEFGIEFEDDECTSECTVERVIRQVREAL